MSKKKTGIKSLQLVIGGKEIDLTMQEAKTLFGELEKLFGPKHHHHHHTYRPWWDYPGWVRYDTGTFIGHSYTVSDNVSLNVELENVPQLTTTGDSWTVSDLQTD